jgi:hypothetical protein
MKCALLPTAFFIVFLSGCLSSTGDSPNGEGSTQSPLSTWSISNQAWSIGLGSGNLNGSAFSGTITYSDSSTCSCTVEMDGNLGSGTYISSGCYNPLGTTGMAGSTCGDFDTSGTGSYTNSGSTLQLCDSSGSCMTYDAS